MTTPATFLSVLTPAQIATVAALAHEIWYEYYEPVIGRAQIDYMVPRFQSAAAIADQIRQGFEYYLVRDGERDAGYLAVQPQPHERRMFISKLYLRREARGSGLGRACMQFIEGLARRRDLPLLWLTVNKGNPSTRAYERMGFAIAEAIVIDIGNGYVMDDFRMEKRLPDG